MLPFNKRNVRTEEVEDLKTGDILEAVRTARRSARPAPRSARPEVFEHLHHQGSEDASVTVMMPSRRTLPPPPSGTARAGLTVPSPFPQAAPARQEVTQHFFQPPPAHSYQVEEPVQVEPHFPAHDGGRTQMLSPTSVPVSVARSYVEPMQPAYAFPYNSGAPSPASVGPSSVAPVAMAVDGRANPEPSDPRFEVPATVITTRTKILNGGRPTVSWAAALVAMGIFAGLVTAVVARGDGDTMVDATVAFADSHGVKVAGAGARPAAPAAVAAKTPVAQPAAPVRQPLAGMQVSTPQTGPQTGPILGDVSRVAQSTPSTDNAANAKKAPTPPVMSYATPRQEPKVTEAKIEPKIEPKVEAKEEPKKVAAAPAVRAAARPATPRVSSRKPATSADLASAEEAKKLADMQLEAALR